VTNISATASPWEPIEAPPTNTAPTGVTSNAFLGGVLGGVEKVQFVKVAYDSLVGALFIPRRYTYALPYVTNSRLTTLRVTRTITAPDILFTAADLVASPPVPFADPRYASITNAYVANNAPASPGGGVEASVFSPTLLVTFNKAGTIYYNYNPAFLDLGTAIQLWSWGSFDGSTNAPIVYPTGSSLALMEEQVLAGGTAAPTGIFNPVVTATNGLTNVVEPLQY